MSKKEYAPLLPIELRNKIKEYRAKGYKIPPLRIIRSEEQIAGIRESAKINTALLDYISENIREGITTQDIDDMVYEFTTSHGA
ncbi:MAG: methionine aminopeptidase, partial [Bacteroidales bacterium]|nr:methionine aminopeptidase [Bacteroidales bacterium]